MNSKAIISRMQQGEVLYIESENVVVKCTLTDDKVIEEATMKGEEDLMVGRVTYTVADFGEHLSEINQNRLSFQGGL